MLRKIFKRNSNDFTKRFKIQSLNSSITETSSPNASIAPVSTCACATSMPNVSVIERSTSLPILVSDASIADLQSSLKRYNLLQNEHFQINTLRFSDSPPHSSRTCPLKESAKTSSPEDTARTESPSKGSLNNLVHKDPYRICLPEDSPWIGISKKLPKTGSLKESPRSGLPKDAPKTRMLRGSPRIYIPRDTRKTSPGSSLPKNAPDTGSSKDSLNDFLGDGTPRNSLPTDAIKICLPNESPKSTESSTRSCILRERCKSSSKPKKTLVKCECNKPLELFSSDEGRETEDKGKGFEELYVSAQAKKSNLSPSRVPDINGRSSETLKNKPVLSTDSVKIKEEVVKCESCGRILQDSGATSSLADSRAPSATCDASASYYQNKLMATLQVLQNKEETITIQADSLAVAEERIATLNERAHELKKELDRKTKEYTILRKSVESKAVEKTDVCVVTDRPMEDQRDIVNTLENNLSVIEDLYRECFYETAKQENLIEMLRSSYLEVRLMDKQKADQIGRLQTVINTQKWSLDRCQDIALEVDGLKTEISNFLNVSSPTNNDSGMWERSEESYAAAPGVHDELHDVRELLLRLQDLLALDSCTCDADNMEWKKKAEGLEIKVGELQEKLRALESGLPSKRDADLKIKAEMESKEQEVARLREQLIRSQDSSRDQSSTVDAISIQLGQAKALLCEKTTEVAQLRQENETQANKIVKLQEELAKADQIIKENSQMRSEVEYLSAQVSLWRAQLGDSRRRARALDAELARTRELAAHIDSCYREKASNVSELQAHLDEAHERGTALCGEARRAVCAVRAWMRRMRDKHRELDNLQKEKESCIAVLQRRLEEIQNDSQLTSPSENIASCSKCRTSRHERSFGSKSRTRWGSHEPSANEIPSCSSTPAPMRLRKRSGNMSAAWMRDAALQEPVRHDAATCACPNAAGSYTRSDAAGPYARNHDVRHVRLTLERAPRDVSPAEQLLLRVEQLSEALADGNRRWSRARDAR